MACLCVIKKKLCLIIEKMQKLSELDLNQHISLQFTQSYDFFRKCAYDQWSKM